MIRRTAAFLTCALCACSSSDPPVIPVWQTVHENLPGALLRVWGRNARDVYAVGADGDGAGSLVLHFDGARWKRLQPGTTGDIWWVWGVADDDIRMVGEGGLVLRYRPSSGAFERITTPEAVTLFGVWGRAPNDVWYVGGTPSGLRGAVWHDTGTIADRTQALTTTTAAVFKAHGFDDGSMWVVGQTGLTAFFDGSAFVEHPSGTMSTLFTVHGSDRSQVIAVGGEIAGVILSWDGTKWVDETPADTPPMNAVWVSSDRLAHVAGFNGRIFKREDTTWSEVEDVPTFDDLHSIWVDEEGGIWAVGGRLASDPPKDGVLVHYGREIAVGLEQ